MNTANFVYSVVSLAGIWALFQWLYRDYRVDLLQDRLFTLRDELFDIAAEGRIGFDHPAYCMFRATINGFLRESRRLGWVSVISASRRIENSGADNYKERWESATRDLESEDKARLDKLRGKMNFAMLDHMMMSSSALMVTVMPIIIWFGMKRFQRRKVGRRIRRKQSHWLDRMDSTALAVGHIQAA